MKINFKETPPTQSEIDSFLISKREDFNKGKKRRSLEILVSLSFVSIFTAGLFLIYYHFRHQPWVKI